MRDEPSRLPLHFSCQSIATLAGWQLRAMLRPVAFAVLLGLRVLVVVLLRFIRPIVTFPLLAAM